MKPIFFFFLALFLPILVPAQLVEDFSDGDFSSNPEWLGQTDRFTVNNGELQLDDQNPGSTNTTYLYTPAATSSDALTVWECLVRLDFSPSSGNFACIYLAASNPDLSGDQNGYFLKVGGISGVGDALELYRQDGSDTTRLIIGTAGGVGGDPALARIRITRSTSGLWTLFADYTGGDNYQEEGTALDQTYPTGYYFGVYCRYTITRNDAFFFDDIRVDPLFVDQIPPQLLDVTPQSSNSLLVRFDEPVTVGSANQIAHYTLNNGIGNPLSAQVNSQNPTEVTLTLNASLANLQTYSLTVTQISDLAGNLLPTAEAAFVFYDIRPPDPNDMIITEIMANPNSSVGLPRAEYLEIYNTSSKVFQLEGIGLSTGGTPKSLPDHLLLPGEYLILCDEEAAMELENFGSVLAISSFPTLTNGGDDLILSDTEGNEIFVMAYTDSWYQDEGKRDGGWSLELIELDGPYDCSGNWRASINPAGGTPGKANSLLGATPDQDPPLLLRAYAESELEITLVFSEELAINTTTDPTIYTIDNGITVETAFPQIPEKNQVLLTLQNPLEEGVTYTIIVGNSLTDCLGNPIADGNTTRVGLAEPVAPGDLVINEILFYPVSGGSDFLELYNNSGKVIDLRGLRLLNTLSTSSTTIDANFLSFPGEYVVLTEKPVDILNRYTVLAPLALLENALPSFPSNEGNITLSGPGNTTIDAFDYSEKLHSALLDDDRGVSLERLSPDKPTQSDGNWHSAAASVGFATPTYQNSQYFERDTVASGIFTLPSDRFSPDGDGFEDVLLIDYQTDRAGYLANITVFDANGRLIKYLARNELLATTGSIKWDGITEEQSKARIGIYVIWFELFAPEGAVNHLKEVCVLAGNLD